MTDRSYSDDARFMDLALELARQAGVNGEVPVGAIIVAGDRVIGRGSNRVIATSDPTAHAEVAALREAAATLRNYRVPGTTLYVTLEPCAMCAGALVHARVARIVFGCRDPRTGAAGSVYQIVDDPRQNHRIEITGDVRSQESSRMLTEFFEARRDRRGNADACPDPGFSL